MNKAVGPNTIDLMDFYLKRDFGSISKNNLNTPVDFNGNTIVHVMAKNLDKAGFETLRNINPNLFGPDVINHRNNKFQTPIHMAMDRVHNTDASNKYDFISYMIDTLGANPDVPDNDNRVIVSNSDKENRRSIYMNDMNDKYDQLNQNVKESIRNLTKLTESYNPSGIINNTGIGSKLTNDSGLNSNMDFLEKLTKAYSGKQKGGYMGHRIIKGGYSESDTTNSFVARSKDEIMNSLDDSNGSNGRGRYFTANNRNLRQGDDINDTNFDAYITADVITNKKETDGDIVRDYANDSRYKNETNNDVNQNLLTSGNNDNSNVNSSNYGATLDQTDNNARIGDTLWYDDVIPRDERNITTGGNIQYQFMVARAKLQKQSEQIRNARLLGNNDNEKMRQFEQQIRNKLDNLTQKHQQMTGGDISTQSDENSENTPRKEDKRKYNKGTKGNRGNRINHRKGPRKIYKNDSNNTSSNSGSNFRNNFRTEDFNLFTSDERDEKDDRYDRYDRRDEKNNNLRDKSSNNSRDKSSNNSYNYEDFDEDSDEDFVRNNDSRPKSQSNYRSQSKSKSQSKSQPNLNYRNNNTDSETEFDDSDDMDKVDMGTNNIQRNYRKMNIWSDDDSDENDILAQERPRDEKTDEMYRSFIKKIMELLGVDEETARFYRTALKINVENKNPELRRRTNDALKVKEIEIIMKDKKSLQTAIENIDKDQIKKIMQEKEQEGIRRREENKNKNKDRPDRGDKPDRSNKGDKPDRDDRGDKPGRKDKTDDSTKIKDSATSDSKTKKPRKTKDSTAENGYIQSEEIIFSSDH